jgi:hypothetical protein
VAWTRPRRVPRRTRHLKVSVSRIVLALSSSVRLPHRSGGIWRHSSHCPKRDFVTSQTTLCEAAAYPRWSELALSFPFRFCAKACYLQRSRRVDHRNDRGKYLMESNLKRQRSPDSQGLLSSEVLTQVRRAHIGMSVWYLAHGSPIEPPSPSPPSKLTRTPSTTVDARQHKDSLSLKRTSLSQSKRHVTPPATPKSRPTTPVRPATPRLFPTPSNSESPQRAGVTKRMLGRTKTETSLPSTPSSSSLVSLQRTASFSSFSKKIASPPKEATPPPPLPPREPSPSRATHRTYAKSRSFLVALPTSDALGGETQEENDEAELRRESYTDLRARWGLDPDTVRYSSFLLPFAGSSRRYNSQQEDENEANSASQLELKSISEMRHKGETRRFLDEVGYLFEGLDSKMSTAVKQNR